MHGPRSLVQFGDLIGFCPIRAVQFVSQYYLDTHKVSLGRAPERSAYSIILFPPRNENNKFLEWITNYKYNSENWLIQM